MRRFDPVIFVRFNFLADSWNENTIFMSSVHQIMQAPEASTIVDMGEKVVPYILERMKGKDFGPCWHLILAQILGDKVCIPISMYGKMRDIANLWIKWGEENGYVLETKIE